MSAADVVGHFHNFTQVRSDSWMAGCPCCQSKRGRPIALTLKPDGVWLINAFCGCDTGAVLSAVGLKFEDLFPERLGHHIPAAGTRGSTPPAREILAMLVLETNVVAVIAAQLMDGRTIGPTDWERLSSAASRINKVAAHVR